MNTLPDFASMRDPHAGEIAAAEYPDLFVPETLVPAQIRELMGGSTELTPEQKLAVAVINDAMGCLTRGAPALSNYSAKTRAQMFAQLRAEAMEWLMEDDDGAGSFTFWCQVIGLDAVIFRAAVLEKVAVGEKIEMVRAQLVVPMRGPTQSKYSPARDIHRQRAARLTIEA